MSEPQDFPTTVLCGGQGGEADRRDDLLERGTAIGRYILLGKIGQGGMGVVYSAYDPDLNRRVAIKVLRSSIPGPDDGSQGTQALLLREARAMAQLSHANVLPIFDVGMVDERLFIATEFVEGQTVKAWVADRTRSWREVLRVFLAAGEGLTAAHRAGLIHRDFKPQNVMVGNDGTVRVMDFGLARLSPEATERQLQPANADTHEDEPSLGLVLGEQMTAAGFVQGTPAYMAPEQHAGDELGPPADQYAFCVALWEALYGTRPFRASEGNTLAQAKCQMILEPARERAVPRWIRRVLLRGMAPEPTERWPSMERLLHTLQQDPARRARRVVLVSGLLMATGGVVAASSNDEAHEPCGGAQERVTATLTKELAKDIRSSFLGTRRPHAADTADRLLAQVEAYSEAWSTQRTQTCRATRVHQEQSEVVMERKMACLDDSLQRVEAYLDALAVSSSETAMDAALAEFPRQASLEMCKDAEALARRSEVPIAAGEEEATASLRLAMHRLNAHTVVGDLSRMDGEAERVKDLLATVTHGPTRAEALYRLSLVHFLRGQKEQREGLLEEVRTLASQLGDYALLSEVWNTRLWTVAMEERRFDAARELIPVLESAAELVRDHPEGKFLQTRIHHTLASVELSMGNLAAAEDRYRATLETSHDPVPALNNLAVVLIYRGRSNEARKALTEAEQSLNASVHELHPFYADVFLNRGLSYHWQGDLPVAAGWYERAVDLGTRSIGDDSYKTWLYQLYLGHLLTDLGRWDDAERALERAQAGFAGAYGEGFEFALHPRVQQARVALGRGDVAEARRRIDQAIAARGHDQLDRLTRGYAHPLYVDGLIALAEKDWGRATDSFSRAVEAQGKLYEPDSLALIDPQIGLARAHAAAGRLAEAQSLVEHALTVLDGSESAPNDIRRAWALEVRAHLRVAAGDRSAGMGDARRALGLWRGSAPEHPHVDVLRAFIENN